MSAKDMLRDPATGINIAIVGGGIGGMAAAIECFRKGHNVQVYERRASVDPLSALVGISMSARRSMEHWPGFLDRLMADAMPSLMTFYKYDGKKLAMMEDTALPLWRSRLHEQLHDYAKALGIPIQYGRKAVRYFETEARGGVEFEDGGLVEADLVVAADGIGSRSTRLIVENPEAPTSSGYAIYRASFPLDHAFKDPVIRAALEGLDDGVQIYLADGMHIVNAKSTKTNTIAWTMTHKDEDQKASESWSADCPASDALPYLDSSVPENSERGWPPFMKALIEMTPDNCCINWKLRWRSPQPIWYSPKYQRVVQIGDACHPFIPTSGSGAVMAIEDAYSLATCLQLGGGKSSVPIAVKVHNKLRFERVSTLQRRGFENREKYHNPDWTMFEKKPESLKWIDAWVYSHDAEKYSYENFDKCREHLENGKEFQNTNTPEGLSYKPWTVQGLLEEVDRKE